MAFSYNPPVILASNTQHRESVRSFLNTITAMSKRPPDLPADVWLYIFQLFNDEYDEYDKCALISLASVNKFLRGIALPVLFRTLDLSSPELKTGHSLKNTIQCFRDINASPHVLNVIRRLTLTDLYICPFDDDMSDSSIESDDYFMDEPIFNLVELKLDVYREIMALVSHLPRLDHLAFHQCSFTLESLSLFFCIPNLQSLLLFDHTVTRNYSTNSQVAVTNSSLCVFQYAHTRWSHKASGVELCIALIRQLVVFAFPLDVLTHLADSNLPTLFNLQKLSISDNYILAKGNQDDLICIGNFLSLAPNLRELRIFSDIRTETPFIIPDTVIPHLKTLMAPSYIANCIASGRALEKLHILVFRPKKFREGYTVVSRDIKHVIYDTELDNPEDLIHLAQVFPEASTIEISLRGRYRRKKTSAAVLSILPKFHRLKQCTVSAVEGCPSDYERPPSRCPVGRVGDPKYRSHPTLEELQIISFHRWIWCPTDGWYSVHSPYEVDALDTLELFELCIAESENGLGEETRGPRRHIPCLDLNSFQTAIYAYISNKTCTSEVISRNQNRNSKVHLAI